MLATDFPQANKTYTKPAGWTDEQCSDLRTWEGNVKIDDAGTLAPAVISYWKPSKEDIEAIVNGGGIWLSITGYGMPPVALFTENPFEQ